MQHTSILALSLLCMAAILWGQANAKCGECNLNGAACISKTSYNFCYNNVPVTTSNFSCADGEICVAARAIKCIPEASAGSYVPACDDTPLTCNKCSTGSPVFTCTSRTTFAQCSNLTVTGKCPTGLYCQASTRGDICISECKAKSAASGIECDSELPVKITN